MDRKAWIAIVLSVVGLIVYQIYYVNQQKAWLAQQQQYALAHPAATPTPTRPGTSTSTSTVTPTSPGPVGTAVAPGPVLEAATTLESAPAETRTLRTAVAEYTLSSSGGIQQVELLQHKAENGKHIIINAARDIPIAAFTEDTSQWSSAGVFTTASADTVVLESQTPAGVKMRKIFTIPPAAADLKDVFQIKVDLQFSNPAAGKLEVKPWFLSIGSAIPIHRSDQARYTGFDFQLQGKTIYNNVLGHFDPTRVPLLGIQLSAGHAEYRQAEENILWGATKNQYYTSILRPRGNLRGNVAWATRFELPKTAGSGDAVHYGLSGALGFPAFSLNAGDSHTESFELYTGPKEYSRLKKLDGDQHEVMEFGFFKFFSEILLNTLNWIHDKVKNYAAAIIILTLIIKTGLWTIQNKSMRSMKKMSLLAPKMNELKVKYKDDPTRMNQEVMKLYKDYGINPLAGCLPIFIQMPIFFGFYSMLAVAVELRNSSFLWVDDLSQPDTVAHVLGFPINLLPIVMAISMLWQMLLTPRTGDAMQQRVFLFMPIIFLAFSYNYASALALYWTVQNIFSIVQLYLTRNQPLPELVKVGAIPAGAKSANRKKLK